MKVYGEVSGAGVPSKSVSDGSPAESNCHVTGGAVADNVNGEVWIEISAVVAPVVPTGCTPSTLDAGLYAVYVYDKVAYNIVNGVYEHRMVGPTGSQEAVNCLGRRSINNPDWHLIGEITVGLDGYGHDGPYTFLGHSLATSAPDTAGAICITNGVPVEEINGTTTPERDRGNQAPIRLT